MPHVEWRARRPEKGHRHAGGGVMLPPVRSATRPGTARQTTP